MPPVSRFGGGGLRDKKKQGIIAKLKAFFEKYFGLLSPAEPIAEKSVEAYEQQEESLAMVAEDTEIYGKK